PLISGKPEKRHDLLAVWWASRFLHRSAARTRFGGSQRTPGSRLSPCSDRRGGRGGTRRRRGFADPVDERKANIVAHRVKAPDFVDRNLVLFTQAPRDIDHTRGDVQVES